jgi:hypothetical protein
MGYSRGFKNTYCYARIKDGTDKAFGGGELELELWVGTKKKDKQIIGTIKVSIDWTKGLGILELNDKVLKTVQI